VNFTIFLEVLVTLAFEDEFIEECLY